MNTARHPLPRHLTFYGFLAGVGAGAAVYYGVKPSHGLGILAFAVVWYVVAVGIRDVLTQPHRRERALYVASVPAAAAVAAALAYAGLGDPLAAGLIALAAAPVVQWLAAHLFLRRVVADKREELRRRAGLA